MKILIDMNMSPSLVTVLNNNQFEAIHWSTVGATNAPDREITAWAQKNNYVILTAECGQRRHRRFTAVYR